MEKMLWLLITLYLFAAVLSNSEYSFMPENDKRAPIGLESSSQSPGPLQNACRQAGIIPGARFYQSTNNPITSVF